MIDAARLLGDYRFEPDLARAATLLKYPQVRVALERLAGRVTAADMRSLNYAADVEHRDIPQIVSEFLRSK